MIAGRSILLIACGAFYALLCVFSIVTGVIYMSGKKELNPLELSDQFMEKLSDPAKRAAFARKMGAVTFVVGIIQGITSVSLLRGNSPLPYWFALGFTVFSIASVVFKLRGKIHAFPLLKFVAYAAILVILFLGSTRSLFFS